MRLVTRSLLSIITVLFLAGCGDTTTPNRIPIEVADVSNIHHPSARHFTSGQPTEAQLATFKELGVATVINLRSHAEMKAIPEAQWAQDLNLDYYQIPISGGDDLTRENVAEFHRLLNRPQGSESNAKVLMHCASSNRVGAMMALQAAWFEGASKEQALKLGRDYGLNGLAPQVEKLLSE